MRFMSLPSSVLSLQADVDEFVGFLRTLVGAKEKDGKQGPTGALAAKIVREFRETGDASRHAQLFRGAVVASQINAASRASQSSAAELDTIPNVCEYSAGDGFDLEPGVALGVQLDLVQERLEDNIVAEAWHNNAARSRAGLPLVAAELPVARDMAVRTGGLDHFDLWVKADSLAGQAIATEFKLNRLSGADGAAKRLELLQAELDSRRGSGPVAGGCPACTLFVLPGKKECPVCFTQVPEGFIYAK
ncbi:unnamed protein product [Pylaiella littoralis]